jgi:hypothetical protein
MTAQPFEHPCTGHVAATGFGDYLNAELGEPRRNLALFSDALKSRFAAPYLSLVIRWLQS